MSFTKDEYVLCNGDSKTTIIVIFFTFHNSGLFELVTGCICNHQKIYNMCNIKISAYRIIKTRHYYY